MTANSRGRAVVSPMAPQVLGDIGMIELLECDPRPTFILDLERTQDPYDDRLNTVFSNASLQLLPHILDLVQVRGDIPVNADELGQYSLFKEWATSTPTYEHMEDGCTISFEYQNLYWTGSTLRKRWRIISGSVIGPKEISAGSSRSPPAGSQQEIHGINNGSPTESKGVGEILEDGKRPARINLTWVDDLPMSEHVQFFKSTDWSATALGPLETWTVCLRQMTRLLMADSRAVCLFWYKPHFLITIWMLLNDFAGAHRE